MENFVILVAAGMGKRMGMNTPKQFIILENKPVIVYAIDRFVKALPNIKIILVLPADLIPQWHELARRYQLKAPVKIVSGGKERFHSVKNGIAHLPEKGLVAIHDGVRPCVSCKLIQQSFSLAEIHGNAIPAVIPRETVREVRGEENQNINRKNLRLIQTPQTFSIELIRKAYKQEYREAFTDDASVLESLGEKIVLFTGDFENIKITHLSDIELAKAILSNRLTNIR